ncbi:MAG: trans-aconitate 2-methyltransferase [Acidobacteria bacterium]|nr:trans-aconitate 2-methyltransferase [Acidobacteriota bacterium]
MLGATCRPFFDLTARIDIAAPRRVVDLGCGPGNLTATLARRWPEAEVVGVDSSAEMIQAARSMVDAPSNLSFALGSIDSWQPESGTDVVVSNAALQWVPGHQQLIENWLEELESGAWLAIQVPGNFRSPSHALMRELAESPLWAAKLAGVLRHDDTVGEPADYLNLLLDGGAKADAWETTYQQVLTGEQPVLNWVRGTGLRPILDALSPEDTAAFEATYAAQLAQAYPATTHGTVYPFRRLFAVGRKL